MGKKVREYKSGDFIFAKVKGYPAWPARVQRLNGKKYFVYFYGTGETANLPPNMIFDYVENKDKFLTKPVKRRDFNDGVKQIEYDFANNVPLEDVVGILPQTTDTTAANDTVNSVANSTVNNTISDETINTTQNDTGIEDSDDAEGLVIDEGKKGRKGKGAQAKTAKEPKTPRGKPKKEEVKEEEEEIVSRSGRKIRPKRYIDEQTEENATLPAPAPKKRRAASPVPEKEKEKPENKDKYKDRIIDKNMQSFNAITQAELEDVKDPFKQEYSKKDNILLTYLPSGKYIGVRLFQGRPTTFKNEATRLQWDKQSAANAITLKLQLEKGHITTDSVISQLVTELNLTEDEKATLDRERETEEKRCRVQFLKTEMKLIELDAKIKTCLCLEKADTELCLTLLDEFLDLDVKPLMLLKHPTCLETIKRMRAYVGNTPSWELSESAAHIFSKQAHKIRKQADVLYRSLKEMFITPEGLSFWEYFTERVMHFKKATALLTADELLELVHEPLEMSMPTPFTMQTAIIAANEELPPVDDDEEDKKKSPVKAKKISSNGSPSKQAIKRQNSRKQMEEKEPEVKQEVFTDESSQDSAIGKEKDPEPVKVEKRDTQEKSPAKPAQASKRKADKEEAKNTDTVTVTNSTKNVKETKVKEEKQEAGETRAKRTREIKKTEPPPLRSPAKRRSKF